MQYALVQLLVQLRTSRVRIVLFPLHLALVYYHGHFILPMLLLGDASITMIPLNSSMPALTQCHLPQRRHSSNPPK